MRKVPLILIGREIISRSKEFLGFSEPIIRLSRFYNSKVCTYEVGNYGTLKLVNLACDVIIEPLINANDPVTTQIFGDVEAKIQQNVNGEWNIAIEKIGKNEKILIKVPVKYGLEAKLIDSANLTVSGLETEQINLESEEGNITLKNLRAEKISAISQGGNISCEGVTQGSINLETTSKGSIVGKRFQGPKVVVKTDSGDISVQSTYSDSSFFETNYGSMNLKNLHRQAKVNVFGEGDVDITGLDGSLEAYLASGKITIQISNLIDNSFVNVGSGSLTVYTPEDPKFIVKTKCDNVDIADGLKTIVKKEASSGDIALLCNVTYGGIRIDRKDWFSTLGIKFNE